jgi:hypothetical protein
MSEDAKQRLRDAQLAPGRESLRTKIARAKEAARTSAVERTERSQTKVGRQRIATWAVVFALVGFGVWWVATRRKRG